MTEAVEVARPRVTVYFDDDIYEHLEKRAKEEVRSVANLVEFIVVQEVADVVRAPKSEDKDD